MLSNTTVIATPRGAQRQAARNEAEARERARDEDTYRRALYGAGCRVVDTATGWIAISPAGLALYKEATRHG
jgi:hypothetical protein